MASSSPWPALVAGLRHDRIVHDDGSPYLDRYHVVEAPTGQVRLHHWRTGDDQRAPHDHPWASTTLVLEGRLVEHTAAGATALGPGDTRTRTPREAHRIELVTPDAWTLFVTGPIVRRWGFHTAAGWVHWTQWPHAGRYET